MTGLPMVENRLPRAAAEGQDRHVAAKGERPSLDPQRLARLDRRDLVPTDVQRRMKQAKEDGRAKVDSALEIGRASWRDRVCQYGEIEAVAVSLKKQKTN